MLFLSGCSVPIRTSLDPQDGIQPWRGRLAIRVLSEQPQSFSAGFELAGNAATGELILYTPLGSTAAALSWSSGSATMRANGEVKNFSSLEALVKQALGVEVPVSALFAWLGGTNMAVPGWSADLSQHELGRVTARRMAPAPLAELRVVLEK